ncbi:MAG: hypothetical protein ABR865_06550 [Terracidiphilus sp.]|jgi:hypothetical protein
MGDESLISKLRHLRQPGESAMSSPPDKMKSAALCGASTDSYSPHRPEGPRGRTREKEKLHL